MKPLMRAVCFCFMLAVASSGLLAEEKKEIWKADATRGEQLAIKLCASCHLVQDHPSKRVVVGVPSFKAMMGLPNQRISNTLMAPHEPMPNMQLTRNEIADMLAYFDDMRRKAAGKPVIPETGPGEKPKYPSRS